MKSKNDGLPASAVRLDGKELRAVRRCGSIQSGYTLGQVVVSSVARQDGRVVVQTYYCGAKESERTAVSTLIETRHLAHQKLSLDARYLIPSTLTLISTAGGIMWWG